MRKPKIQNNNNNKKKIPKNRKTQNPKKKKRSKSKEIENRVKSTQPTSPHETDNKLAYDAKNLGILMTPRHT